MSTHEQEMKDKFWTAFKAHPLIMMGMVSESGGSRPMTAQFDEGSHSCWFFTTKEGGLFRGFTQDHHAVGTYSAKDHKLFATVAGTMILDNTRERIDRFWNRYVAAWYDGKDDPKLALLRFDPASAEVWLNDTSLLEGVKLLLGADPKREFADQVAKVHM